MALTVGIAALVAGLLRLSFLASFISEPVMKGFIIGLSLTIIVGSYSARRAGSRSSACSC